MPVQNTRHIKYWIALYALLVVALTGTPFHPPQIVNAIGTPSLPTATPLGGGEQIAYSASRSGTTDIYVTDINGHSEHRLTFIGLMAGNFDPTWSPDGRYIAFASDRGYFSAIYIMEANGKNQHRITSNQYNNDEPSWSPDGSRIAFVSARDGNAEIYVMTPDGKNQTRLTNNTWNDDSPTWSPDGKQIAFSAEPPIGDNYVRRDIFVMNADGSDLHPLTKAIHWTWTPAWSPRGDKIAFVSAGKICMTDVAGNNLRCFGDTDSISSYPSWSPDGSKIVFQAGDDSATNTGIDILDIQSGRSFRLVEKVFARSHPVWSPR